MAGATTDWTNMPTMPLSYRLGDAYRRMGSDVANEASRQQDIVYGGVTRGVRNFAAGISGQQPIGMGATGGWDEPTKAQKAVTSSVQQSLGSPGDDADTHGRAPMRFSAGPNVGDVTDANTIIAQQLSNITGAPVETSRQLLSQPLPAWNKGAGEQAMLTNNGAARQLNYGYGTNIIGQGMGPAPGGKTKLNSFSGVGTGAAPAGAAGVFGQPPTSPDSFAGLGQLFSQQMRLAAQKGEAGDALGQRRITNNLVRMAQAHNALASQAYQGGQLALGARQQGHVEAKDLAAMELNSLMAGFIQKGDPESLSHAARLKRVSEGLSQFPIEQVPMLSGIRDPNKPFDPQQPVSAWAMPPADWNKK